MYEIHILQAALILHINYTLFNFNFTKVQFYKVIVSIKNQNN